MQTPVLLSDDSKQPLSADSYGLFFCSTVSVVILRQFTLQHNRRQPLESKTIKRASQPKMTVRFKFLPHEILNKPKPTPAIRIYPQANREACSDASQASDHHPCPPLITEPTTHKPQKKKKREKKKKLTHASPLAAKPTDQSLAADPSATCRRHHHCRSGRQPPPSLVPSLSSSSLPVPPSSHHHSRRSPTPQSRCRSTFYLEILFSFSFCVFLFFSFCPWFAFPLESII